MMADELSRQGVIRAIFDSGFSHLEGLPWAFSLAALALCYFYAHYGFASLTAHISALYPGFLGAALAVGIPAPLAAWTLAFLSNLNAGLTHYGTGSAPVYFAGSYIFAEYVVGCRFRCFSRQPRHLAWTRLALVELRWPLVISSHARSNDLSHALTKLRKQEEGEFRKRS